jgi:hypothetical protein
MTDRKPSEPTPADSRRQKRLAEALRANLRRRKAASVSASAPADGQEGTPGPGEEAPDSAPPRS